MFRGPAALMKRHGRGWLVFGGGNAVLLIGAVVLILAPVHTKGFVMAGLGVGAALYVMLVSWGLTPKFTPVELYVDQNGVWADGAALVARKDIGQAQIRRPIAAEEHRINNAGRISHVTLPAYPITVEFFTARGQVDVVPGSDQAAAAILSALGLPVVYAPEYQRSMSFFQWRTPQ
ncbi:MAG: hypothetical protein QOH57_306 [Mycobacterium sp.]|jgi:hypothetical protein|nr:hypothetical protein [Mycobacterium sp.]